MAELAEEFTKRNYPGKYTPTQFDFDDFSPLMKCGWTSCSWFDWWSTRSALLCPCFPCLACINGRCNPCLVDNVDMTDPTVWKKTLSIPTNCPEDMQGVWWLCDNIAAEKLVCFNDAEWTQPDKENYPDIWAFIHDLPQTWTRDAAPFGYILGAVNAWHGACPPWISSCDPNKSPWDSWVPIKWDFKLGKAILNSTEWSYRINADEWQKPSYAGGYDSPDRDKIVYMYRWRRIIRGDGTTTPAWDEWKAMATAPLPHRNCLEPWCCLWPLCVGRAERLRNMASPNPTQAVIWRPEHRTATCNCWSLNPPCPFMCPIAAKVRGVWNPPLEAAPGQEQMAPMLGAGAAREP